MNDYDYLFVIYLDSNNINYNIKEFKLFRKIYFRINFFNIKFFVATPQHSTFLNEKMQKNNIYMIKRNNMLNVDLSNFKGNNNNNCANFEIEGETFEFVNLTEKIKNIPDEKDDTIL